MVDPKKYLGAFFEQLSPQNWGEMLRQHLPAYARRKGSKAEVALRVTYKTRTGVTGTVVRDMSMDRIGEIKSWIKLCAGILSEIGRKHGYAGKTRVCS